jgi:hypothetical protein
VVRLLREHQLITLPPSNLGPQAEPWGREIAKLTVNNSEAIDRLGGDTSNDGRINNSTMDVMASQINELQQRQSGLVRVNSVQTPTFSSGTQTLTVNIQIPRPSVNRSGWVAVQFTAVNSNANQTEVYGSMSIDGNTFHRDSRAVPSENTEPASWGGEKAITGYSGFVAGPDFGGTITLVLEAEVAFSSGDRFVVFQNIQASYQYGQTV